MNPDKKPKRFKDPFLRLDGIRKTFRTGQRTLEVLKGISFQAKFGEWVALTGASGSGKTTLIDIVGTISTPDKGDVIINGTAVRTLSSGALSDFRRDNVGFVFQAYHILPELNILENAMLPMLFAGKSRKAARTRAEELLVSVGLKDRLMHRPNELSGGEQQRAAIARALINDPPLLLADEPTGNLDSVTGGSILELFQKLKEKQTATILMVTHDENVAKRADRIIRLKDGIISKSEKN